PEERAARRDGADRSYQDFFPPGFSRHTVMIAQVLGKNKARGGVKVQGISPPAGGDLLCPWRQSRQNATGDSSGWALACPYSPYPGPRFTGVPPEKFSKISGARKSE